MELRTQTWASFIYERQGQIFVIVFIDRHGCLVQKDVCVSESNGVEVMTHFHSTGTETAAAAGVRVAVNAGRQNNQTTVEALELLELCAPWDWRVRARPGIACSSRHSPAASTSAGRGSTPPTTGCNAGWLLWPCSRLPHGLQTPAGSAPVSGKTKKKNSSLFNYNQKFS